MGVTGGNDDGTNGVTGGAALLNDEDTGPVDPPDMLTGTELVLLIPRFGLT